MEDMSEMDKMSDILTLDEDLKISEMELEKVQEEIQEVSKDLESIKEAEERLEKEKEELEGKRVELKEKIERQQNELKNRKKKEEEDKKEKIRQYKEEQKQKTREEEERKKEEKKNREERERKKREEVKKKREEERQKQKEEKERDLERKHKEEMRRKEWEKEQKQRLEEEKRLDNERREKAMLERMKLEEEERKRREELDRLLKIEIEEKKRKEEERERKRRDPNNWPIFIYDETEEDLFGQTVVCVLLTMPNGIEKGDLICERSFKEVEKYLDSNDEHVESSLIRIQASNAPNYFEAPIRVYLPIKKLNNHRTFAVKYSVDGGKFKNDAALPTIDVPNVELVGVEIDVRQLTTIECFVISSSLVETIDLDKDVCSFESSQDRNIQLSFKKETFDGKTTLGTKVISRQILNNDIGDNTVKTTGPFVELNFETKPKEDITVTFFQSGISETTFKNGSKFHHQRIIEKSTPFLVNNMDPAVVESFIEENSSEFVEIDSDESNGSDEADENTGEYLQYLEVREEGDDAEYRIPLVQSRLRVPSLKKIFPSCTGLYFKDGEVKIIVGINGEYFDEPPDGWLFKTRIYFLIKDKGIQETDDNAATREYIEIRENGKDSGYKIPLVQGRLRVSSIKEIFPSCIGLYFKDGNDTVIVARNDQDYFIEPSDGWQFNTRIYFLFTNKGIKSQKSIGDKIRYLLKRLYNLGSSLFNKFLKHLSNQQPKVGNEMKNYTNASNDNLDDIGVSSDFEEINESVHFVLKLPDKKWHVLKLAESSSSYPTERRLILPAGYDNYKFFGMIAPGNLTEDDICTAAGKMELSLCATNVSIICRQRQTHMNEIKIECVQSEMVIKRLEQLDSLGFTEGPPENTPISVTDGEEIIFTFEPNLYLEKYQDSPFSVQFFNNLPSEISGNLLISDRDRQVEDESYHGYLKYEVSQSNKKLPRSRKGRMEVSIPKSLEELLGNFEFTADVPAKAVAKFIAWQLTRDNFNSTRWVVYASHLTNDSDLYKKICKEVRKENPNAPQREQFSMFLWTWISKYASQGADKVRRLLAAHRDDSLVNEALKFGQFHEDAFSDSRLKIIAYAIVDEWKTMAAKLGFSQDEINDIENLPVVRHMHSLQMLDNWRLSDRAIHKEMYIENHFFEAANNANSYDKLLKHVSKYGKYNDMN